MRKFANNLFPQSGLQTASGKAILRLLTMLLLSASTLSAFAQEVARLEGRVFDENGAIVIGAKVTLDNNQGNKAGFLTDKEGRYSFARVGPGNFTLTVSAQGFTDFSRSIEIQTSALTNLDVTLKVSFSERLEIFVQENNLTETTITGEKLTALPADSRRLLQRLQRLAGVSGNPNDLVIYVDGFRSDGNLPPKETIAAIRINADPFSAEYAEQGRARVEIITKPATERFRGELNFYFADESLNARNPFAQIRAPQQMKNISGAFSGPIRFNNWGYFLEFYRNDQEENAVINALTLNQATFQPLPFKSTVLSPVKSNGFSVRTSKMLGKIHTFDARFGYSFQSEKNQGLESGLDLPERGVNRSWRDNSLRFSLVSVFSEKSFNEARLSLSRGRSLAEAVNTGAALFVLDFFTAGGNQESLFLDNSNLNLRAENNFTQIIGNHNLKFGVLLNEIKVKSTDRSNFGGTFIFGTDVERSLFGFPISDSDYLSPLESYRRALLRRAGYRPLQFSINQGDPFAALTQWEGGAFAEDTWIVSPRLTVSYGLRAEAQTNLKGLNLAPRVGLAVRPFKNIEGTLRAGAGIFYSRIDAGITLDAIRFDGSRQEELFVLRPAFFPIVPAVLNRAVTLAALRPKAPDLTAPYSFISTVSYEQQLFKKLYGSVSFNWQRGVHLLRTRNINAPLPRTNNERPNPNLGPVLQYESAGNLKRHEFNVGLHSDLTDKISFYGSYRLAFSDSDTDGAKTAPASSYDLSAEFGNSILDQRHQFYFEAYLQLPWKVSLSPNLFVASGIPFNITTGNDDNGDTLFTERPAFAKAGTPGAITTPFGVFNPRPQPGERIIPRNFGRGAGEISLNLNLSRTFTFGREEGAQANSGNCETGVLQRFRCGFNRRYGLTLSADVFNVLNCTNFGEFNGIITSPLFGQPNRAKGARQVQIGASLNF